MCHKVWLTIERSIQLGKVRKLKRRRRCRIKRCRISTQLAFDEYTFPGCSSGSCCRIAAAGTVCVAVELIRSDYIQERLCSWSWCQVSDCTCWRRNQLLTFWLFSELQTNAPCCHLAIQMETVSSSMSARLCRWLIITLIADEEMRWDAIKLFFSFLLLFCFAKSYLESGV